MPCHCRDERRHIGSGEDDRDPLLQISHGQYFALSLPSPSAFHSARQLGSQILISAIRYGLTTSESFKLPASVAKMLK